MNSPQSIVLGVGATVIAGMSMFPPWYFAFQAGTTKLADRFAGYHPIWEGHTPTDTARLSQMFSAPIGYDDLTYFSIHLDTTRLSIVSRLNR